MGGAGGKERVCGKRYLELLDYQLFVFIGLLRVLGTPSPVALPFPLPYNHFWIVLLYLHVGYCLLEAWFVLF